MSIIIRYPPHHITVVDSKRNLSLDPKKWKKIAVFRFLTTFCNVKKSIPVRYSKPEKPPFIDHGYHNYRNAI